MKSIRNNCEHNERYKQNVKGMKEREISVLKRQQIISLSAEMGVLKTSKYAPTYFLNEVNVNGIPTVLFAPKKILAKNQNLVLFME